MNVELALSWEAADVARGSGTELFAPELKAVEGLWGRLCAQVGWKEALAVHGRDASSFATAIEPFYDAFAEELGSTDGAFIADDVCSSQGWLIDPELAFEVLLPAYSRAIGSRSGVGFHSDGDISSLFPALREAGFAKVHLASVGYVELDRIVRLARAAGLRTYGGIAAETLSYGLPSEELCGLLAGLSRDEGLVISDDAGITDQLQLARLQEAFAILTEL